MIKENFEVITDLENNKKITKVEKIGDVNKTLLERLYQRDSPGKQGIDSGRKRKTKNPDKERHQRALGLVPRDQKKELTGRTGRESQVHK